MKYRVTFTVRQTFEREVEADSPTKAKLLVQEGNSTHLRRDLGDAAVFSNYLVEEIVDDADS